MKLLSHMNIKILKKRKAHNRWKTVLTYRMNSRVENSNVRVKGHAMKTEHSVYWSVYKSRSLNCNLNTYTPTTWLPFWPSRSPLIWLVVILIKPHWSTPRVASACQCRTVWICRRSVAILWKPKRSPKFKHICFHFEQYSAARLLNFCDIILSNYHFRLWPVLGHI